MGYRTGSGDEGYPREMTVAISRYQGIRACIWVVAEEYPRMVSVLEDMVPHVSVHVENHPPLW